MVSDDGQEHLRQIKACRPDQDMEPVVTTQVGQAIE